MSPAERWTSPPLTAREAPSRRRASWASRLVATVLLALVALALVLGLRALSGAGEQDPGVGSGALPSSPAAVPLSP